ncbi:MAG: hypothetical protein ACLVK5_00445 [Peptoniphilus senegalensis]
MAYRKGYKFHGNHQSIPDVYSHVTSYMRANKENGAQTIAIIGDAKGGKPGDIMFIRDPEDAKEFIKGGDLLEACLRAYDPVTNTKTGVEIGGADTILAIRANSATQASTDIFQAREEEAKIGEVVSTVHANTTGKLTVSGTFTGKENKTFKVVITSDGINDLENCKYNYKLVTEDKFTVENDLELNDTQNATNKDLGDGIKITFGPGKYNKGDTFLIPCTAPVTVSEFVYTITSKDYGEESNLISHKLEDGTAEGTKRLVVYDGKQDEYEVFDNLGGCFSIKYKGTEAYAALTITANGKGDSIKLQTFKGQDKENAIIDIDLDLDATRFKSIKSLSEYIKSFENYETEMVSSANSELTVNDLDFYDKVDIKEAKPITAVLRDLTKTLRFQSNYVEAEIVNKEVSNYKNYPFTPLNGGSEGTSASSYVKFLDKLSNYDLDYVVPLTVDMSIIAEVKEHCLLMSSAKGKERRMVCGLGTGITAGGAIQNAKKLRHQRVQYVGQGMYDYDENGNIKLFPAYIIAAQHAGRAAFLKAESATADTYRGIRPELEYSDRETRQLIDNGVIFFQQIQSDYDNENFYPKLVWDYTTFTDYDDPLLVERSTGAIADIFSKRVRKEIGKMLTGKLTPFGVLESARNKVISLLQAGIKEGIIVAYKDVTVEKHRDKVNIRYGLAPTLVTNFTFVDQDFYVEDIKL